MLVLNEKKGNIFKNQKISSQNLIPSFLHLLELRSKLLKNIQQFYNKHNYFNVYVLCVLCG